jgi:hypothetical protein
MLFIFSIIFFIAGIILRPQIVKLLKKHFSQYFHKDIKRYEVQFKIEFYNQPSIHHLGEEGKLARSEAIKIQIDAESQDEALSILEGVIKQEVKAELLEIKEIPKI